MSESVPCIQDAEMPEQTTRTTQTMSSVHEKCCSRLRPSLQNLPLELLESIFLYSTNFALPRSNPLLGAKLSAKITLLRLFMVGFHDTWDQLFGVTLKELYELKFMKKRMPEGDSSLQVKLILWRMSRRKNHDHPLTYPQVRSTIIALGGH